MSSRFLRTHMLSWDEAEVQGPRQAPSSKVSSCNEEEERRIAGWASPKVPMAGRKQPSHLPFNVGHGPFSVSARSQRGSSSQEASCSSKQCTDGEREMRSCVRLQSSSPRLQQDSRAPNLLAAASQLPGFDLRGKSQSFRGRRLCGKADEAVVPAQAPHVRRSASTPSGRPTSPEVASLQFTPPKAANAGKPSGGTEDHSDAESHGSLSPIDTDALDALLSEPETGDDHVRVHHVCCTFPSLPQTPSSQDSKSKVCIRRPSKSGVLGIQEISRADENCGHCAVLPGLPGITGAASDCESTEASRCTLTPLKPSSRNANTKPQPFRCRSLGRTFAKVIKAVNRSQDRHRAEDEVPERPQMPHIRRESFTADSRDLPDLLELEQEEAKSEWRGPFPSVRRIGSLTGWSLRSTGFGSERTCSVTGVPEEADERGSTGAEGTWTLSSNDHGSGYSYSTGEIQGEAGTAEKAEVQPVSVANGAVSDCESEMVDRIVRAPAKTRGAHVHARSMRRFARSLANAMQTNDDTQESSERLAFCGHQECNQSKFRPIP